MRADATNFATCGIDAMQRGRRSLSHACLLKSSSSSAVVVRSTVTALNAGGAGAFTVAHSSMIDAAPAAFAMKHRCRERRRDTTSQMQFVPAAQRSQNAAVSDR